MSITITDEELRNIIEAKIEKLVDEKFKNADLSHYAVPYVKSIFRGNPSIEILRSEIENDFRNYQKEDSIIYIIVKKLLEEKFKARATSIEYAFTNATDRVANSLVRECIQSKDFLYKLIEPYATKIIAEYPDFIPLIQNNVEHIVKEKIKNLSKTIGETISQDTVKEFLSSYMAKRKLKDE